MTSESTAEAVCATCHGKKQVLSWFGGYFRCSDCAEPEADAPSQSTEAACETCEHPENRHVPKGGGFIARCEACHDGEDTEFPCPCKHPFKPRPEPPVEGAHDA